MKENKVSKGYKALVEELNEKYLRGDLTEEELTAALKDLKRVGRTIEGKSTSTDGSQKLLLG